LEFFLHEGFSALGPEFRVFEFGGFAG
jgi:hypothetical protein